MTRYMKFMAFLVLAATMAMAGSDHVALTGDGSNGGLSINPSGFKLTSATYTVEAWVWPSTLLQEGPVMDQFKGSGTQGDWSFMVYAQPNEYGKLALLSRGVVTDKSNGPWFVSDSALPVKKWSHVAVAVDGSTIKFYINGKLDTTHTITSGSGPTLPTSSASFRIGSENRNNYRCFVGNLSDCRVWNTARTTEEIAGNRFVRLAGTEQGLAAYWPLDEGSGSSVTNRVAGTADTVTGGGYSWTDMHTPFMVYEIPGRYVLENSSEKPALLQPDNFYITTSTFSLECWVCPAKVNTVFNTLFNQFGNSADTGDIRMVVWTGEGDVNSTTYRLGFFYRGFGAENWSHGTSKIPAYKWTHLAATCDGDELKLYVDGQLETTVARTAPSRIVPSTTSSLKLLGVNDWTQYLIGKASDMRVWDRALSSDEIASNRFVRLTGREDGLVGYWPLAQAEGAVATNYAVSTFASYDASLSENYAFAESATTPFVGQSGVIDDSCVLSGGRFNTQTNIRHPSYTLEAWVRLNGHGNNIVFSQFGFKPGDLRMTVTDRGKVGGFLRYFVDSNWVYSTETVPLNVWTHIALSYDGQKMKLYINGAKDSEFEGVSVTPNSANPLFAGGTEDGTLGFNGRLSDLRVWNTVRTDEEIAANYTFRLTGKEPYLQGYWPLGQSSGETALNYSRYGVADGAAAETLTWLSGASTPFRSPKMMIIVR